MKKKKIRYWRGFETWAGFDRIDQISQEEWARPEMEILIPIPKVVSVNFSGENMLPSSETTTKRLVFEFKQKLETGIIYKFRGWE